MQQVLHIGGADTAPSTPTPGHDPEPRSPATPRKRFSFSTWTSPLKSLRPRRKSTAAATQSPTMEKHNPSAFSLFRGTRFRALGSTDASKDGVSPHRPKSAAPSKNHSRGDENIKPRPRRSKSFADLLGSISIRVSSKYNTVSGRNEKVDITDFNYQPQRVPRGPSNGNLDLSSASRSVDEHASLTPLEWQQRIQKIELEMSAFWELEKAIENFKRSQTTDLLGLIKDDASAYSAWEGSDKTLYNLEDELLDRATPKYEDEKTSCGITPSLQSDLLALSAKISAAASFVESSSNKRDPVPASTYRHDVGGVYTQAPRFKDDISANQNSTIAERIQLTVDNMTKTRHMNPSTHTIDGKSLDREAASDGCGPPPYRACTDSSIATLARSTDSTPSLTTRIVDTAAGNHHSARSTGISSSKIRAESKQTRMSPRKARQVSNAPVRVTFPDTSTGPGHMGIYKSRSEAISGLFEKNNGELSNVCAYDSENRIIHAYWLGSAPNSSELLRRGFESIWLPLENRQGTEALLNRMLSDELLVPEIPESRQTSTSSLQKRSSPDNPPPMADTGLTNQSMTLHHDTSELSEQSKIQYSSSMAPLTPKCNYLKDDLESDNESFSNSDWSTPSHFSWSFEEHDESPMEDVGSSQLQGSHQISVTGPLYRNTNAKMLRDSCEIDEWRKIGPLKDCMRSALSQRQHCVGQENIPSETHRNTEPQSKQLDDDGGVHLSSGTGEPISSIRQDHPSFSSRLHRTDSVEPNLELPLAKGFPFTAYVAELLEAGGQHGCSECVYSHSNDGADSSTSSRPGLSSISPRNRPADQANALPTSQHALGIQVSHISKAVQYTQPNFIDKLPGINGVSETDGRKCSGTCSGTSLGSVARTRQNATGENIRGQTIPFNPCKSSCTCVSQIINPIISSEPTKVAGLVEIFQARGMIRPSLISALQRTPKLSTSVDSGGDHTLVVSNDLVNKLGTVNDTTGSTSRPTCCPLPDPDQGATRSLATTPDSSLGDNTTEVSSMFGERLHRFAKVRQGSGEATVLRRDEESCRDSLLYG